MSGHDTGTRPDRRPGSDVIAAFQTGKRLENPKVCDTQPTYNALESTPLIGLALFLCDALHGMQVTGPVYRFRQARLYV